MRVKEESEKAGLILNIQKTKIMVSGPITSWQIEGEKRKQWQTILLGSKVTADSNCSHEIKRHLLLGTKAMANLESILRSIDITLLTEVCIAKPMTFPVAMCGCEIWTIKRLNAKELMLSNCGAGEDTWESLGLQGNQISPS